MRTADFDYPLPKERIAQDPPGERDGARLLVMDRSGRSLRHASVRDLPEFLRRGDVLVLNDTRVIPARMEARRETGGRVDVLLVEEDAGAWRALLDTPRKIRAGERLAAGGLTLSVEGRNSEGLWRVVPDRDPRPVLAESGRTPLPPYIRRPSGDRPGDRERYQTVYARQDGSVAAPTAGLHLTPALLERVRAAEVEIAFVTLHVGVGTFLPVRAGRVEDHRMLGEQYRIPGPAATVIEAARREGRRVVAVGTTVVRTLESWARTGRVADRTDLFIHPPFEFRVVGALMTNFHLPRGTPLLLAAAFAGWDFLREAYAEAVRREYRFLSYGDATLVV